MKILSAIIPATCVMAIFLSSCSQVNTDLKVEQPETHIIRGRLVVPRFASSPIQYWDQQVGKPCSGTTSDVRYIRNRYGDINPGIQVVVKTSQGEIVGVAELGEGRLDGKEPFERLPEMVQLSCYFPFEIKNVPKSNFYTVEVGNRDTRLTFPIEELEQKNWQVTLSLN